METKRYRVRDDVEWESTWSSHQFCTHMHRFKQKGIRLDPGEMLVCEGNDKAGQLHRHDFGALFVVNGDDPYNEKITLRDGFVRATNDATQHWIVVDGGGVAVDSCTFNALFELAE